MSNKSRKNKNQSPKQEPERTNEKTVRESVETASEKTMRKHTENIEGNTGLSTTRLPNEPFSFETTAAKMDDCIKTVVVSLEYIARELNTETIFGITAARFQTFADKIKKYPEQLKKKATKERRLLTQTETKEEKKKKKSKALRERIETLQTKLAAL